MPLAVSGSPESRLPPARRFREHVGARQRKGNGQGQRLHPGVSLPTASPAPSEPTSIWATIRQASTWSGSAWDSNPHAVRGHMTRREAVTPPDDDYVELTLDTFHDQRHGFLFDVNPRGMQADARVT